MLQKYCRACRLQNRGLFGTCAQTNESAVVAGLQDGSCNGGVQVPVRSSKGSERSSCCAYVRQITPCGIDAGYLLHWACALQDMCTNT
jgi:hypothetical protein